MIELKLSIYHPANPFFQLVYQFLSVLLKVAKDFMQNGKQ